MLNIYLISEFGDLLRDLPTAFTDPRVKIHFIGGPDSVFNKLENFLKIPKVSNMTFIQSLLLEENLINSIDGLAIIGSDPEMREIAQVEIKLDTKLELLPIKNPEAFKILDSKVGLQEVMEKLKLSAPLGIVVTGPEEFSKQKNQLQPPYLIKGDQGGGGALVRRVSTSSGYPKIDDIPFPFLLQEEIIGSEISVDAFFVNGNLRAYIYSDQIKAMSKFGPSYLRRIANPPIEDFLQSLKAMGEFAGAHGLVNTTFIFDTDLNKHFMIEFDPRPTAWHFLAPILGIDLISMFTGSKSEIIEKSNKVNFRITILSRYINYLSHIRSPWKYFRESATLFRRDFLVVNRRKLDTLEILTFLISITPRILAFRILKELFQILPYFITNPIKQRQLTNRIARKIIGNV
jgi:hypothetical protein